MIEKMKQLQQEEGKELGEGEAGGPRSREAHVMIKSKKRKEKKSKRKEECRAGKEMGRRKSNRPRRREIKRSHVQYT